MKQLNFNSIKSSALAFALLFFATAIFAQDKPEECKLLVSNGFTITKIDGKKKTVNSGRTVKIVSGKHKLTYNHTYMRDMMGMPSSMSMIGSEIEFDFKGGKSYKLDASAEVEYKTGMSSIKSPGPPEITEIK